MCDRFTSHNKTVGRYSASITALSEFETLQQGFEKVKVQQPVGVLV